MIVMFLKPTGAERPPRPQRVGELALRMGKRLVGGLEMRSISSSVSGGPLACAVPRRMYLRSLGPLKTSTSLIVATSHGDPRPRTNRHPPGGRRPACRSRESRISCGRWASHWAVLEPSFMLNGPFHSCFLPTLRPHCPGPLSHSPRSMRRRRPPYHQVVRSGPGSPMGLAVHGEVSPPPSLVQLPAGSPRRRVQGRILPSGALARP